MNNTTYRTKLIFNNNLSAKRILILNLMPDKVTTEQQFLKVLKPLENNLNLTFLAIENKEFKHISNEYINKNYSFFSQIKDNYYDGLIITGAPVEQIEFEQVDYAKQLAQIIDWASTHVSNTLYICWASQFALNHFYGIEKEVFDTKLHGVFEHQYLTNHPLTKNIEGKFLVPHSRYSQANQDQILTNPDLRIIAQSNEAGVHICESLDHQHIFISGHLEYDFNTLEIEYNNAINRGESPAIPKNYYRNNHVSSRNILDTWSDNALTFFQNWLDNYVSIEKRINITV